MQCYLVNWFPSLHQKQMYRIMSKSTQAGSIRLIYPGHGKHVVIQHVELFELTRSNPATAITPCVCCALMIPTQWEWRLIISQGDKKLNSDIAPPPVNEQGGQLNAQIPWAHGNCRKALLHCGQTLLSTQASSQHWALLPASQLIFVGESTPPASLIRFPATRTRGKERCC